MYGYGRQWGYRQFILVWLGLIVAILLGWSLSHGSNPFFSTRVASQQTPDQSAGAGAIAQGGIVINAEQVAQLEFMIDDGLYGDDRQALESDLENALAYVRGRMSERFPSSFAQKAPSGFRVEVVRDTNCSLHGLAYTDQRAVQVYTCDSIPRERAVAIAAHEFVHRLAQDTYGQASPGADIILLEGLATWGAGAYWGGGQADFRAYVRAQRDAGVFYPLATSYNDKSIETMNALYYQWASFVDYLLAAYGPDQFDRLYVSGPGNGAPGSANYVGVYGKGLDALEQEWQAWLDT